MACLRLEKHVSPVNWKQSSFWSSSQQPQLTLLPQWAGRPTSEPSLLVCSQHRSPFSSGFQLRWRSEGTQRWRFFAFAQPNGFEESSRNAPVSRGVRHFTQNDPDDIPLWLWLCKSAYNTARDALQFLREQPGQLKFIDWPSLQSTVRMAMLTVIVVALLIVFLATMDSTFSYILASILRRVPK